MQPFGYKWPLSTLWKCRNHTERLEGFLSMRASQCVHVTYEEMQKRQSSYFDASIKRKMNLVIYWQFYSNVLSHRKNGH